MKKHVYLIGILTLPVHLMSIAGTKIAEGDRKLISEFAVVSVEHYEIRGNNAKDLNLEMRAKGHTGANGLTTGKVKYDFACQGSGGSYSLQSLSSICVAKVRLPTWYGVDRASADLKQTWTSYYEQLRAHEMGHVAICANAAKSILAMLRSMPSSPDCNFLHSSAVAKAESAILAMQRRQESYDVETNFGAKSE